MNAFYLINTVKFEWTFYFYGKLLTQPGFFFNENTNRAWDNKRVPEREPMLRAHGELYYVCQFSLFI